MCVCVSVCAPAISICGRHTYIYILTHRISWETCVGHSQSHSQVLLSMLAVNLFHLHFVCLPPFFLLPYAGPLANHYDDLWAEIIFWAAHWLGATATPASL